MSTIAPRTLIAQAPPVASAGNTAATAAAVASAGGRVTAVTYTPAAAITGAATNNRRLRLVNKGDDGTGTTVIAELQFSNGVNADAFEPTTVALAGTIGNRDVSAGDVLAWESAHVGTGIADPGGLVHVTVSGSN